jgi:hypothetical protein
MTFTDSSTNATFAALSGAEQGFSKEVLANTQPRRSTTEDVGHVTTPIDATDARDTFTEPSEARDQAEHPITHHYLTFNTTLPSPSTESSLHNEVPPPDLSKLGDPFSWSPAYKMFIAVLSAIATSASAYAAGSYEAGSEQMTEYFGVSNVALNVGITTFCIGFAVAPMVLAPFSEVYGRRGVFVWTGVLFVGEHLDFIEYTKRLHSSCMSFADIFDVQ